MTRKINLEVDSCNKCPYAAFEDIFSPSEIRCMAEFGNGMLLFSTEQDSDKDILSADIEIPSFCELEKA